MVVEEVMKGVVEGVVVVYTPMGTFIFGEGGGDSDVIDEPVVDVDHIGHVRRDVAT